MAAVSQYTLPGGSIGRELQKTLFPGETVLAYAQGKANQLLMATDQRVIIIKGAVGSGGTFFGTTSLTYFYPQVMGVQVRKQFGDGFVEVSAAGMQNTQRGRTGQINAPNIVPFNGWDEKRFQEVAMVIRQQLQRIHTAQPAPMQNIIIAVGDHAANEVTINTVSAPPASMPAPVAPVSTLLASFAPPAPLYQFQLWEVIALGIAYLLAVVLSSLGIGPVFFIAAIVYAGYRDWAGISTLRHAIQWDSMAGGTRIWAIVGFVFIYPLAFIVYLWRITNEYFQTQKAITAQRPHKIAQLEAQLGIMPVTEGECRACQKPMQVGAEFCAFCGVDTIERPLVCPNCATTALPDAKFCSKCRTELH